MAKYSDERVDIADLKMLRDILSADKKELQIDIINALGDIYSLSDQIVNNQDIIRKNYRFIFNTFFNLIKSLLFSGVSYAAVINYLDKDPELTYSVLCCFSASLVGWGLFQKDNKENNYVSNEELVDACDNYMEFNDKLQKCTEFYFKTMKVYFGNNVVSIKDEMKKIFDNNESYIKSNIECGRFLEDFSYETVLEVACDYFDDKVFKDFMSYYDKNEKQRKI